MASVRAFQPRKVDPPQFVAEDGDELAARVGEIIGGEQCDRCGNSAYRVDRVGHGSPEPIYGFTARCVTDPDQDPEQDGQFTGCGIGYPIGIWDEDAVTF